MTEEVRRWWQQGEGRTLRQGDYLPQCFVVIPPVNFSVETDEDIDAIPYMRVDLIVLNQSCDLVSQPAKSATQPEQQPRAAFVTLCRVYSVQAYEEANPLFRSKDRKNNALAGRQEGLYFLASPDDPSDNRGALIVDFYQVFSLPRVSLEDRAEGLGPRWSLLPPYLEHFSQAFGHFFMRVGLPDGSAIPRFQ